MERMTKQNGHPMVAEMVRKTKLVKKQGKVEGQLDFYVKQENVLHLPADLVALRTALFRRVEGLSKSRFNDDSSYLDAVEQ